MMIDEAIYTLANFKRYISGGGVIDKQANRAIDMAIEVLERKRGEWIVLYDEDSPQDGIWKCSTCGYTRLVDDITPINYCPNCGADMWCSIVCEEA